MDIGTSPVRVREADQGDDIFSPRILRSGQVFVLLTECWGATVMAAVHWSALNTGAVQGHKKGRAGIIISYINCTSVKKNPYIGFSKNISYILLEFLWFSLRTASHRASERHGDKKKFGHLYITQNRTRSGKKFLYIRTFPQIIWGH